MRLGPTWGTATWEEMGSSYYLLLIPWQVTARHLDADAPSSCGCRSLRTNVDSGLASMGQEREERERERRRSLFRKPAEWNETGATLTPTRHRNDNGPWADPYLPPTSYTNSNPCIWPTYVYVHCLFLAVPTYPTSLLKAGQESLEQPGLSRRGFFLCIPLQKIWSCGHVHSSVGILQRLAQ